MKKKILIVSLSAGSGHLMAASAVEEYIRKNENIEVKHIDLANYINTAAKTLLVDAYELMAKNIPELWGFIYDKTDNKTSNEVLKTFSKIFKKFPSNKFLKEVKNFAPDYILGTHFTPAHILNAAKIEIPIGVVITDYDLHALWLSPNANDYFVANEKIKWKINKINKVANTVISGIPTRGIFYEIKNQDDLNKRYGIKNKNLNVLILAGGKGLIKTDKIINLLNRTDLKLNLFAVAGKNKKLFKNLKNIKPQKDKQIEIIEWTDKIDELMRVADVIISKPGGISVTECIVLQKPIFAINPIPGQEEKNSHFILEQNVGKIINSFEDLEFYIEQLSNNKLNFHKIKMPIGAKIIVEEIKKHLPT